ncbi:DNA repair protein Rtt107 [Cordyceps fumosorosea ARSEF 2679]|uniref:DNA repair protein Rtt107 n=1 Tax=Cordyceps fumosorosea (strain ARSEF 2679) TaxID=1081104 RepID=A0A167SCL6_CORFA|nr:DNA repair protein Rtt107 [Cordyceps fumosorosea ARSEF 2679]OAA59491.1 DNA repair protein Rtt107 [Cordyceps fumosorosea ARSEF 2679]
MGEGLFSECAIAFVPSSSLTPKSISELTAILEDNGAEVLEPRRNGTIAIDKATHVVSNTIDFQQYTETQAFMIPVVTTHWITASVAKRRVAQARPFSPDPRLIFAEVVVTCADLPATDKESILGAVMALGGQESKDATRITTHVCALSMDHPKVQVPLSKGWKGKVVLPHWFDDCFKLGKRIDETPYLLPDVEILKKAPEDALDIPVNDNLDGATSPNPQWLPLPPDDDVARPPCTVFQQRKVLLGSDLSITPRLAKTIGSIIVHGGGRMVDTVDACDMYIGQYRDGEQYVRAAQSCKDVGNLSWLYYLIVQNSWTSSMRRLLHYPVPRDGIEGFRDLRITVSNYGGETRIYLENLVKACGAEFTKTMKADNTHLITARDSSPKVKAAPEWGVAVVNHLWIEESYAKCQMKPINIPKYNHFPHRTNLGEIIGQTFLDESRLRELYYPGGEAEMTRIAKRKRKILEAAEDNAYRGGPADGVVVAQTARDVDEDVLMEDAENSSPQKAAPMPVETPVRPRHVRSGKENDTPSVASTGGRSAKAKARDKLQSIAPDIALYEKEKKRSAKATTPFGGKRATDLVEKQRVAEEEAREKKAKDKSKDTIKEDEVAKRPSKKARPSLPDVEMRIILTGFTRWVDDKNKEDADRRKLRDLGIQIVQEGQPCEYLAAPHIVRTVKFLCALARGPEVISSTFIDVALETGKLPPINKYALKDKEAESRYNFTLDKSVGRAKANRGRLLQGVAVYCTEGIKNGPKNYQVIAEANGAIFKIYRARSGTTIKPTTAEQDGGAPPDPVYLLSGASAEEKSMWPRFREMAIKGHMEPRIVAPDWLLDVAMAQQVRYDPKFAVEKFWQRE